jgi:hypothetical protein
MELFLILEKASEKRAFFNFLTFTQTLLYFPSLKTNSLEEVRSGELE